MGRGVRPFLWALGEKGRTGSVNGDGQPTMSAPKHDNAYDELRQGLESAAE